jgi:hypothetical protein
LHGTVFLDESNILYTPINLAELGYRLTGKDMLDVVKLGDKLLRMEN